MAMLVPSQVLTRASSRHLGRPDPSGSRTCRPGQAVECRSV